MKKTLVIIPTYNEADNIIKIIPEVLKNSSPENEFNILVVDDNSPDGTAGLVEEMKNDKVKLELGDVLWHVAVLAETFGFTLEEIAEANIKKRHKRMEEGTIKGDGDYR